MKLAVIRLLVLSMVVVGVSVQAEEQVIENAQTGLWLLSKYDTNGDQVISTSEVTYKREKMFGYMDTDEDGAVSFSEYQGLDVRKRELLLKARFQKLDRDHDGRLSGEEYGSYLGSFERFDSDGDGNITALEMSNSQVVEPVAETTDTTRCLLWLCVRSKLD